MRPALLGGPRFSLSSFVMKAHPGNRHNINCDFSCCAAEALLTADLEPGPQPSRLCQAIVNQVLCANPW